MRVLVLTLLTFKKVKLIFGHPVYIFLCTFSLIKHFFFHINPILYKLSCGKTNLSTVCLLYLAYEHYVLFALTCSRSSLTMLLIIIIIYEFYWVS